MSEFKENIIAIGGEQGQIWLDALPGYVQELAQKWHLEDLTPFADLSYNYVLHGMRKNKMPIVLKLIFEHDAFTQEYNALVAYAGSGCVKVLDADVTHKALLLEQAMPGNSLVSLFPEHDEQAVHYAVLVMQQLHSAKIPQNKQFPTIADWLKELDTPAPMLQGYHLQKAKKLGQELLANAAPAVLLHGDLHHANIVASSRNGWLAIDPKGVLGEPAYEVGAFIRNPYQSLLQQQNVTSIIQRRLKLFAELLSIDYERIKAWSYVQAVLADCWAAQHSSDSSLWLAEAKIIDAL